MDTSSRRSCRLGSTSAVAIVAERTRSTPATTTDIKKRPVGRSKNTPFSASCPRAITRDVPKQVKIRTDPEEGYAYRYDTIERAARRLDRNKTDAIVASCEAVGDLLSNVEAALQHDELPPALAEELADEISTRYITVKYDGPDVDVDVDL